MKKTQFSLIILATVLFLGLCITKNVAAQPLISGGNAVTSSSTSYYGYTEPYATVSYNSLDAQGNRILLGYGKADKKGYFNFKLSHRLRTGVYSWVYLTSNQHWTGGQKLNGRVISTGTSKPSDFSAYERVIDGAEYFDSNDPSNTKNRNYLGGNAVHLRNKSVKPLASQTKLPEKITIPQVNDILTTQIASRSQENYPYGNLFTYQSITPLEQGTENNKTGELHWRWHPIATSGAATNNNQNISFVSKIRSPQAITVNYDGMDYDFASQQGVQFDSKGNIYYIFDIDTDLNNTGAFVMRISASYAHFLSQKAGKTIVDGKETPIWLSKDDILNALDSGNIALSKAIPAAHGATLSVVNDVPYVLATDMTSQILYKLSFQYALGVGPQNTGTTAKYKDTNRRSFIEATPISSGTFVKNDGKTTANGIHEMPKNLTMVDATTGYFVIPYSKDGGNQKGFYGYAIYQIKVQANKLIIRQIPLIIQNMLGNSGKDIDPAQSITYNPNDGRMYITANDVWASFDLAKYLTYGEQLFNKYEKVSYSSAPSENANPVEKQLGTIDIGITSTKFNSTVEVEQLAFWGNKTYLLVSSHNQLLINK